METQPTQQETNIKPLLLLKKPDNHIENLIIVETEDNKTLEAAPAPGEEQAP